MASVKQFEGCSTWTACYKVFVGFRAPGRPLFSRLQRATGLRDKLQAQQIATSLERASVDAAVGKWNQSRGKQLMSELNALTGVHIQSASSAKDYITRWLTLCERDPNKSETTLANYRSITKDFYEFLGQFRAAHPLHDISTADIIAFRDREVMSGKAVATINKALSMLRCVFRAAAQSGVVTDDPFIGHGTLSLKKTKKTKQKRSAFTIEQFRLLIEATKNPGDDINPEWHTFILVTGYTGGRQQEPAKLEWDHVDLERGFLILRRSKKDDELLIPLHPTLQAHLNAIRPRTPSRYVMPAIAALPGQALSKIFRECILPKIGIVQPYHLRSDNPEKGKGRVVAKYGIHSLRHSLSTWLNANGVSDATRMAITGHDDPNVSRGYTHPDLGAMRKAIEGLPAVA